MDWLCIKAGIGWTEEVQSDYGCRLVPGGQKRLERRATVLKARAVVVRCEHGLHARVAARVVKVAQNHEATVHIRCEGCPRANACSILELLCLGAGVGTRLQLVAEGPDEDAVVDALTGVFQEGGGI